MRWQIIVAGKPALAYAKSGCEEYLQRLQRYVDAQLLVVKAGSSSEVSQRLWEKSQGSYRVVLDERGDRPTTRQLSDRLAALEMRGEIKAVSFLIGASDGHTAALREQADWLLSLSSMTMQHELAQVVLLEQLYRVATLRKGEPYHRD
ncbi:MAG: 23S rRNA (pseudouridine(1915)-N(3))-methyltransferase RlmH [Verrucomicrobia bacterium]|jgi:23S rRNA (pseudouridine1915-N3)-methyltransferase|nr:MAG: 23S rRNA (pseudouridine(1915)-N(3))-methyltransferase RlmH [Verrucomicrobiota bacterium]